MKTPFAIIATGLLVFCASSETFAASRVEADPNKEYVLTPEVGPYVICVKGYMGPSSRSLANALTLHTRRQGFAAYVYDRSAESKREVREMLEQRYRNTPELAKRRTIRVEENWGVMVGGYRDMESAGKDIARLKQLPWDKELPRTALDHVPDSKGELFAVSPYAHAFAARNPLIAVAKADPNAPDPAWKSLNDGRPYNLLKCGKPWTVAVKQFAGANVVQARTGPASGLLNSLGLGDNAADTLAASAMQAEEVAKVLRKNNFDAYVLHTRAASVVTVGAFDSPEDPKILSVQQKLRGLKFNGLADPRVAEMFQFFAQPMPMKVPRL